MSGISGIGGVTPAAGGAPPERSSDLAAPAADELRALTQSFAPIIDGSQTALARGGRGGQVESLQHALELLGHAPDGGADGVFGRGTERALLGFQRATNVDATGRLDAATVRALDETLGSLDSHGLRSTLAADLRTGVDSASGPLARGARGEGVAALQRGLALLGYVPNGGFDGAFGGGTERALEGFQVAHGLAVSGTLDEETYELLNGRLLSDDVFWDTSRPGAAPAPRRPRIVATPPSSAPIDLFEDPDLAPFSTRITRGLHRSTDLSPASRSLGPSRPELERRYGRVSGHMDGQSHPAINRATGTYDMIFGRPFRDRPQRRGRQFGQNVTLRSMEEAISTKYRTTDGALRSRFGGQARPNEAGEVVDMRTRLFYHSPLNDRRPPGIDDLASGRPMSPRRRRRLERHRDKSLEKIDAQIDEVKRFAAGHPKMVVAHDAAEARRLMNEHPDHMVMLTSVEGGTGLLNSQGDADALRERGVTHLTLIHLGDDENGAAATVPGGGFVARLVNPRGVGREARGEDPGLTGHGVRSLNWLSKAGVVVDLAHMSQQTLNDALNWCEANGVSPILSHGFLDDDHATEPARRDGVHVRRADFHGHRAITEDQLVRLYRLGGQFGMVLSGKGHDPSDGTMGAFVKEYERLIGVLHEPKNIQKIFGLSRPTCYEDLSLDQRTRLSLAGAAADFNAINPADPSSTGRDALPIERLGLSDPGVVPSALEMIVRDTGGDPNILEPLLLGAERSLQISEKAAAQGAVFRMRMILEPIMGRSGRAGELRRLDGLADGLGNAGDAQNLAYVSGLVEAMDMTLSPATYADLKEAYCDLEDVVNAALYRAGRASEID